MAYAYTNTIISTFNDRRSADRAVAALRAAGFKETQIGVAAPHAPAQPGGDVPEHLGATGEDLEVGAEKGAATGAILGASVGALVGLGIVAGVIPVIGPIIAGGTLAVILADAAGGAAIAGLGGALIGMGISEGEAEYYEGALKTGKVIVTVQAEGRGDEVAAILSRNGGHDRQNHMPRLHDKDIALPDTTSSLTPGNAQGNIKSAQKL